MRYPLYDIYDMLYRQLPCFDKVASLVAGAEQLVALLRASASADDTWSFPKITGPNVSHDQNSSPGDHVGIVHGLCRKCIGVTCGSL